MSASLRDFLQHISDECTYLLTVSKGKNKEDISEDETLKRAVTRSIEIIGEAVKKLDEEFIQKYPHVEWRKMARTRDKMIHNYFGIDYDIVWEIITEKIPTLKG